MKKKQRRQEEYNNSASVASILKWGTIGFVSFAAVGGGTYYAIRRAVLKNRQENEYDAVTDTNKNGKQKTATVGNGQTPAAYAQQINAALKATNWAGIPDTDEETVYKLLIGLNSQYEVALVSKSFNNLYSIPLQKGLENDLDSDELIKALNIITRKPSK
jgi:hypothetical protein